MKIFSKTIVVQTKKSFEFIRIDQQIEKVVQESGMKDGFLLLRVPHTTAALVCNEPDPTIHEDTKKVFQRILPEDLDWQHTDEGKINARAHQASLLLGQTHWSLIKNGKISLGTWQGIFLVELFRARERKIEIVIVGERR